METKNAEMQQVMDRLERVEKQNRRLVRGGMVLVLTCGSVLLMAQKPQGRTIEAEKFILKDAAGKVRAELHITDSGPELALYSASEARAKIQLYLNKGGMGLSLDGGEGTGLVMLTVNQDGPALDMIKAGPGHANGALFAIVKNNGPNLTFADSNGFSTSIGSEALVTPSTGEKSQTSAASIHLFGPKGTLWSAP